MIQQRLTIFFPIISEKTSPSAKCPFLELPPNIRRRIYHEAGIVSGMIINMNAWATRKKIINGRREPFDHTAHCNLPSLPLSLFAVSRLINDEISQVFYGENDFVITRRSRRGLRALELFSDSAMTKFRSLTIRLNLDSCDITCCGDSTRRCGNGWVTCVNSSSHDTPLGHASTPDQVIISQWHRICTRLSKGIQPDTLALYVICDCQDRQTIDMIVNPLLTLPVLRDFGFRLARDYNKELQVVAKYTALRLTARSARSLPTFRFLDLPNEIQLQVLEQTSLVSVHETICERFYMQHGGLCPSSGISHVTKRYGYLMKCLCCRGHSAFNFHCSECENLGFPHALFLVSRKFRDAAIRIFYGRNTFAVLMAGPVTYPVPVGQNSGVSSIPILNRFPKGSIGFITVLKLDYRVSGLEQFRPGRARWESWLQAVKLLSEEANPTILSLEIRLSDEFFDGCHWSGRTTEVGYEERALETYYRLVQPLTTLKGLKNLFIQLNWRDCYGVPGIGVKDGRQEMEQKLERSVMGEGYDAWKCGKTVRVDTTTKYWLDPNYRAFY